MAGANVLMQLKNKMQQLRDDLEDHKDKLEQKEHVLSDEQTKRQDVGVVRESDCMAFGPLGQR